MKQKPYKLVVRLPIAMREKVKEAAHYYHRSMNSEIVARLEQSFGDLPQRSIEQQVQPPLHPHVEAIFRSALSEPEHQLISVFRRLSSGRQNALLSLLN